MTNKQFDLFLEKAVKNYGQDYISVDENEVEPHEFSARFEKKMQKLIRKQNKFYFPIVKTPTRRFATILVTAILMLLTLTMSISAWREAFVNFITETFKTHTVVQSVPENSAPTTFENIYEITAELDRFELTDTSQDFFDITQKYSGDSNKTILFIQSIKKYYDVNWNTEGYSMENISINGHEGFYIDMNENKYIVWDNGDFIFTIITINENPNSISKDELITLANSVQKVEE